MVTLLVILMLPGLDSFGRSSKTRPRLGGCGSLLPPEILEEVVFESVSGVDDELEVALEDFLTSIFSSWMLMLLFPPRRGGLSFQRNQSVATGIVIVRKILMPMMVHNPIDPDILYDSAENKDEPSNKNLLAR